MKINANLHWMKKKLAFIPPLVLIIADNLDTLISLKSARYAKIQASTAKMYLIMKTHICNLFLKQPFGHGRFPQLQVWFEKEDPITFKESSANSLISSANASELIASDSTQTSFAFAFLSESFFVSAVDQTFPHWLNWPCSRAMCKKLEFVVFSFKIQHVNCSIPVPFHCSPQPRNHQRLHFPGRHFFCQDSQGLGALGTKGTHWVFGFKVSFFQKMI